MVEFSTDLHRRLINKEAFVQRATLRVSIIKNEIPHYNRGIAIKEFSYDKSEEFEESVRKALSDFDTTVVIQRDRVVLADIGVSLPV